jgi:SAM-dependent methyltransferase
MDVPELRAALERADRGRDEAWLRSLPPRKLEEIEFHDHDRDVGAEPAAAAGRFERETANKKFYSTVGLSTRYVEGWIDRHSRGRTVLDYACGAGRNTIRAARAGATLAVGLDISPVSVENCRRRAAAEGVAAKTYFVQGDCEDTGLPSDSFDTILCMGMLHHLDLSYALPELRRLLRPGGRLLAVEALNYNPAIKLYRRLTPGLRTDWERRHILSLKDVRFARRFFDLGEIRYWHLFSILATPLRRTPVFETALAVGDALDRVALRLPGVAQMAWMFSFELIKPAR